MVRESARRKEARQARFRASNGESSREPLEPKEAEALFSAIKRKDINGFGVSKLVGKELNTEFEAPAEVLWTDKIALCDYAASKNRDQHLLQLMRAGANPFRHPVPLEASRNLPPAYAVWVAKAVCAMRRDTLQLMITNTPQGSVAGNSSSNSLDNDAAGATLSNNSRTSSGSSRSRASRQSNCLAIGGWGQGQTTSLANSVTDACRSTMSAGARRSAHKLDRCSACRCKVGMPADMGYARPALSAPPPPEFRVTGWDEKEDRRAEARMQGEEEEARRPPREARAAATAAATAPEAKAAFEEEQALLVFRPCGHRVCSDCVWKRFQRGDRGSMKACGVDMVGLPELQCPSCSASYSLPKTPEDWKYVPISCRLEGRHEQRAKFESQQRRQASIQQAQFKSSQKRPILEKISARCAVLAYKLLPCFADKSSMEHVKKPKATPPPTPKLGNIEAAEDRRKESLRKFLELKESLFETKEDGSKGKIDVEKLGPFKALNLEECAGTRLGVTKAQRSENLLKAADRGDARRCKALLEAGVDIYCSNEYGQTAMCLAAWHGHTAVVQLLLFFGFDVASVQYRPGQLDACSLAAGKGHAGAMKALGALHEKKGSKPLCWGSQVGKLGRVTKVYSGPPTWDDQVATAFYIDDCFDEKFLQWLSSIAQDQLVCGKEKTPAEEQKQQNAKGKNKKGKLKDEGGHNDNDDENDDGHGAAADDPEQRPLLAPSNSSSLPSISRSAQSAQRVGSTGPEKSDRSRQISAPGRIYYCDTMNWVADALQQAISLNLSPPAKPAEEDKGKEGQSPVDDHQHQHQQAAEQEREVEEEGADSPKAMSLSGDVVDVDSCDDEVSPNRRGIFPNREGRNSALPKGWAFPQMRFLKYDDPAGALPNHMDLARTDPLLNIKSTHTFILYLQGPPEGGETVLLSSSGASEVCAVSPRPGRLFVFPHAWPHEAKRVDNPPKILLRGEMY